MDLASLTAEVCRIAMDAGSFLKEERKTFLDAPCCTAAAP